MIPLAQLDPFTADLTLPSPNHGPRNADAIRLVVLHATADRGNESGAESWMRNPKAEASAHLHFRRDGTIVRLVDDRRRAWHAGVSAWPGVGDVNSESLGWEIANRNDGAEEYTEAQYEAVAEALRHYMPQGLGHGDVVGHFHVSPGRKTDPLGWDWLRMWDLTGLTPAPVIELAKGIEERRQPIPHPGKVHPLRRPVAEIARPGETGEAFLHRLGDALGPLGRGLLNVVIAALMKRAEREVNDALGNP